VNFASEMIQVSLQIPPPPKKLKYYPKAAKK
jgi:hypothetical protein